MAGLYAVSLLGWFAFFYLVWGSPSPTAPYGSLTQTEPRYFVRGGPGLFMDQEYGLLAFAPVYALAATGLWHMWRSGGELRRQAIEIVVIFAALLSTVGAFGIWWGGSSSPSRPIASGLLLLMLPTGGERSVAEWRRCTPSHPPPIPHAPCTPPSTNLHQ